MTLRSSLARHIASGRTEAEMLAEYKRHQGTGLACGLLVVRENDPDLSWEMRGWVKAMLVYLGNLRGGER